MPDPAPPRDLLASPASAAGLKALAAAGVLDARGLERGLALLGRRPTAAAWLRFLQGGTLLLGVGLVGAGAVIFIGEHADALGLVGWFTAVLAAMVGCGVIARRLGPAHAGGRAALVLGALLGGPLVALVGAIHPSDPKVWKFTFAWAALALPFVLPARFPPLSIAWVALVDVGAISIWTEALGLDLDGPAGAVPWLVLGAAHAAAVVRLERDAPRGTAARALVRALAGAAGIFAILPLATGIVVDRGGGLVEAAIGGVAVAGAVAAAVSVYSSAIPDLMMLTQAAFVASAAAALVAGRVLYSVADGLSGTFLLGIFILAEVAAASVWLRRMRLAPAHRGETEDLEE